MKTINKEKMISIKGGTTVEALCMIGGGIALFINPFAGLAFAAYCYAAVSVDPG